MSKTKVWSISLFAGLAVGFLTYWLVFQGTIDLLGSIVFESGLIMLAGCLGPTSGLLLAILCALMVTDRLYDRPGRSKRASFVAGIVVALIIGLAFFYLLILLGNTPLSSSNDWRYTAYKPIVAFGLTFLFCGPLLIALKVYERTAIKDSSGLPTSKITDYPKSLGLALMLIFIITSVAIYFLLPVFF